MTRPIILDLYCGAGGCSEGYARAGFNVAGVDINPQPRYPFAFAQDDAIAILQHLLDGLPVVFDGAITTSATLDEFDAIHASPPCQAHTTMSNRWRGSGGLADERVDLIAATRELLIATGKPYVIENVPGARAEMHNPYVLNGGMFNLGVDRPRLFETNWPLLIPERVKVADPIGVYGKTHDGRRLFTRSDGSVQRAAASLEEAREAMGIPWMEWRELAESIPPAYTEFIGEQLIQHLRSVAA